MMAAGCWPLADSLAARMLELGRLALGLQPGYTLHIWQRIICQLYRGEGFRNPALKRCPEIVVNSVCSSND